MLSLVAKSEIFSVYEHEQKSFDLKNSLVVRSILTIKNYIHRYLTHTKGDRYIVVLPILLRLINQQNIEVF